ncbi:MAG: hypothetical protein VYC17_04895 [Nitrospinota bacterium]|nr:hypothetical protein [Nitrospinota bacterium]
MLSSDEQIGDLPLEKLLQASGPVFTKDDRTNLYYLNEQYGNIAKYVSQKMRETFGFDLAITSGVWGGTYLITESDGKSKRRIWRYYCLINVPQNSPLDEHKNMEHLVGFFCQAFETAFKPYGLGLKLKMWGGRLPYSNAKKPSITMHLEDTSQYIRWMRAFFVWNTATWEESVIHDAGRNIKVLKESLDLDRRPVSKETDEIKFLLQDVIITYRTLENSCHPDFIEHAKPIIEEMKNHFLKGLIDPKLIQELYLKVYENALVYGFEQALAEPYSKAGLDVRRIEDWPVDKINWVPEELKEKLIPPISDLFEDFRKTLGKKNT